jgi:hypothetical protein
MGAQPSIRDWGSFGISLLYRNPDIFVDNDGDRVPVVVNGFHYYQNVDEVGEPIKGESYNRLFAVVRNLGDVAVNNVQVRFQFTPFGTVVAMHASNWYLKEIGVVSVDLGPAGSPEAEKEVEVQWDMGDLTDTCGGAWLAPLSYFDHFCVRIQLTCAGDPNTIETQHNYANILSYSPLAPIPMLIVNPGEKSFKADVVVRAVNSWKVGLRGTKELVFDAAREKARELAPLDTFSLKSKEQRLTILKITPPDKYKEQDIDVSLRIDGKLVGGCSFHVKPGGVTPSRIQPKDPRKPAPGILPVSILG